MNKSLQNSGQKRRNSVAPARLAAFEILQRVETGAYASILLAAREESLEPRDRSLCHELVIGVLRWQLWLDRLSEHFADRSVASLDLKVRIILRLGLYQLRFLSRIPASAAVNESVNLVRLARLRSAESFVNAVLRRAARELEFDPAANLKDPIERLSVATSHPRWLIEHWVQAFGHSETEAFAAANNQPALVSFRLVEKGDRAADILERLRARGASLEASEIVTGAWRVTGGGTLLHELSRAGHIYLQDEASQLVAQVLDAREGDTVLDVCSAPGSKSSQIAGDTRVRVIAGDIQEHRIRTVVQTAKKQRLSNLKCVVLDGQSDLPFREAAFERVLIDAPCSGTGTLRHNPEIRWRISAEDLQDLSARQRQLLFNASRVVKPGGRLVYSTCSVEPEENEAVVKTFLEASDEFEPVSFAAKEGLLTASGAARTWPHRHDTDGFFIAAFARKG
ncbi:MAG: 16S rRNA (cytosine(967)-C(5))-methyltransferase RsmB [Pyrinomonadaceae bacterium]